MANNGKRYIVIDTWNSRYDWCLDETGLTVQGWSDDGLEDHWHIEGIEALPCDAVEAKVITVNTVTLG